MLKLLVVAASILLLTLTAGCLEQAHESPTVSSSAATSVLKISAPPVVNQSDFATFTCQLNMTRGSGLDNKAINWAIDNVYEGTSRTAWGFAAFNLTVDQTQNLSIGRHVVAASFDGDSDYAVSNATTTFQVQAARSAAPSPPADKANVSISLSVPSTVGRGCADLTGTYSNMGRDQYLSVLVKAAGNDTWKVQEAPLLYANGKYAVHVCFDTQGNSNSQQFDLIALISGRALNAGDTTKDLPTTAAESRVSTTVR